MFYHSRPISHDNNSQLYRPINYFQSAPIQSSCHQPFKEVEHQPQLVENVPWPCLGLRSDVSLIDHSITISVGCHKNIQRLISIIDAIKAQIKPMINCDQKVCICPMFNKINEIVVNTNTLLDVTQVDPETLLVNCIKSTAGDLYSRCNDHLEPSNNIRWRSQSDQLYYLEPDEQVFETPAEIAADVDLISWLSELKQPTIIKQLYDLMVIPLADNYLAQRPIFKLVQGDKIYLKFGSAPDFGRFALTSNSDLMYDTAEHRWIK